jgi:hypothetical protein
VRRLANLSPGTIWRERAGEYPGRRLAPDTGYGALSPISEDYLRGKISEGYLRGSLGRVTDGDKHEWLVIYCR